MRTRPSLVALTLALTLGALVSRAHPEEPRASSVVLFVGDGMGSSQITLGRLAAARLGRPYSLDRFKTIGLCGTSASNNAVTESSAAATALATGVKTKNRVIGLDPDGRARANLIEVARAAGRATGVVTTARVTDSTPAAFTAHVADRREEVEIAGQLAQGAAPDLLLGGGGKNFDAKKRAALRERGYHFAADRDELLASESLPLVGLFAEDDLSFEVERDAKAQPSLREMTDRALTLLQRSEKTFFLVVEGGRIDHAGHYHDAAQVAREQVAFADAIDLALGRVEHGADLLVLVTGDHATGSLGITERLDLDGLLRITRSVESIFSDPACREDDAALVKAVKDASGLELSASEVAEVRRPVRPPAKIVALGHVLSRRLGVAFYEVDEQESQTITKGHDGALVPVYAAGHGASDFAGTYENTEIPAKISRVLAIAGVGGQRE